jgi:hypothetical protein
MPLSVSTFSVTTFLSGEVIFTYALVIFIVPPAWNLSLAVRAVLALLTSCRGQETA